jgi:hypothetical protein
MRKYRRVITHIHYLQIRNSKSRLACVLVGPCVTFMEMDPQYNISHHEIEDQDEDRSSCVCQITVCALRECLQTAVVRLAKRATGTR